MRGSWSWTDFWGSPEAQENQKVSWEPDLEALVTELFPTVQAGAEVHGVAVAAVPGHGARSDLHHVGGGGPQPLHLGRAVLGGDGVGHGFALQGHSAVQQ